MQQNGVMKKSVCFILSLALKWFAVSGCMIAPFASADANDAEDSATQAKRIFRRVTGVPLLSTDPRLEQMTSLIRAGRLREAAAIATEDSHFYQITVKNLAAELGSRNSTPFIPLDDFQATFIGTVKDELDARGLLTGNYLYKSAQTQGVTALPSRRDNLHYEQIDQNHLEYKSTLIKQEPQWTGAQAMRNHAGLMTTRGWSWNYDAGTNRRAVVNSFDRFLCKPISLWKVPYLDESSIARDVERYPGRNPKDPLSQGNPKVFQNECRTCHGSQDPMRDAFSSLDFLSGALVELPPGRPAPKYARGSTTYPQGHVTYNDAWVNPIAPFKPELGFKPEMTSGQGVNAYGEMIANATAFNSCMVKHIFSSVCQRAPRARDHQMIKKLALGFEKDGYSLKKLFQETASTPACLEENGVKNFKGLYYSLAKVTGIQPTKEIDEYYQGIMTRLPKNGRADEVNAPMLLAEKGLAALFCREFSKANPKLAASDPGRLLSDLSQRIYGRELSDNESQPLLEAMRSASKLGRDPVFISCTAMTSSVEFLVQ